LKNDGVRQWVSDDIPYRKWKKIQSCSKPPTISFLENHAKIRAFPDTTAAQS
jgi:hypothetical protein